MAAEKPSPRPRHAAPDDEDEQLVEPAAPPSCRVDGCEREPETRGLCAAHWQTHRGYAGPREKP